MISVQNVCQSTVTWNINQSKIRLVIFYVYALLYTLNLTTLSGLSSTSRSSYMQYNRVRPNILKIKTCFFACATIYMRVALYFVKVSVSSWALVSISDIDLPKNCETQPMGNQQSSTLFLTCWSFARCVPSIVLFYSQFWAALVFWFRQWSTCKFVVWYCVHCFLKVNLKAWYTARSLISLINENCRVSCFSFFLGYFLFAAVICFSEWCVSFIVTFRASWDFALTYCDT